MELKKKIYESAFQLFLKYGVKSVSMDDISKSLGISKKTIYNVIDNKKELVQKVVSEYLAQEEALIQNIVKNSNNAIDAMFDIAKQIISITIEMNPSLMYDLRKYHIGAWNYIEENHFVFIKKVITQNIHRGIKEGFYRSNLRADIITKLYIVKSMTLVDDEVFSRNEYQFVTLFEHFFLYHMTGISSDKGRSYLHTKITFQ